MSGKDRSLIDTNVLIYFFDGKLSEKQTDIVIKILEESFVISIISKIEFLGFKEFFENEIFLEAKSFLSNATVIPLSDSLIDTIIQIKQKYNLKLGDAIIGATALINDLTIVTRNQKDFDKISNVEVFNPFFD